MNNELRKQVGSILSEVLNTTLSSDENPKRKEMPNWDSLKHMELILRLEEELNVRFSIKEVAAITSLDDLVEIIEVKS
ncbi:phosphopantetheine-binding protein [Paenibacillus faecalis]|uniref:phosphopantetheine-binding protein n=1 Tax=Paenibacillus faecalis TaxID=2079532 RepID=UPI000D0F7240|nr:phosphopantetheine-binding protein [Paenibacillus faecalis]